MDKLKSSSFIYSLANGLGAALIIISLLYNFNFAAFIIEAFWVAISLYGIWKYFNKKSRI
jgi:predicted membrane protein